MGRSTYAEKTQRLNAAFDLLTRNLNRNEAAEVLVNRFNLSLRQAYRYLQEAQSIQRPVDVREPTIPITIKMPGKIIEMLRAYAQASGLTIGETVARAVLHYLGKIKGHG